MTLRELMIERIHYAVSEYVLETYFDISAEELSTLSDEDFLDLYEEVAEWEDPRTSTMVLN